MLSKVPFSFYFLQCGYRNIYLFLAVLGLLCCTGFSLVVASGGYCLVEVCVGFSSRWLLLLQSRALGCVGFQRLLLPGSREQVQQLRHTGLVASGHMGSC